MKWAFPVPETWNAPSEELVEGAVRAALAALALDSSRPASARLLNFYDRETSFAGASFVSLEPREPTDITVADLHATTLLSVTIAPSATRRLLGPSEARDEVIDALGSLPSSDLSLVTADGLVAMERFYLAVRSSLSGPRVKSPNAWVTAGKLCARKRPDLFPVRDNLVCTFLGLLGPRKRGFYQVDWQVFRALMCDDRIAQAIDRVVEVAAETSGSRDVVMDTDPLRLLDAALWTWASGKG